MSDPHVFTHDEVRELIETSHVVADSSLKLAESAREQTEAYAAGRQRDAAARKRFYTILSVLGAIFLVFIAGVLTILIVVLKDQDSIKAGQAASENARQIILDCVTPDGQCFKDGQDRTGDLVLNLNKVTLLSAVCAQRFRDESLNRAIVETSKCIQDNL